MKNLKELKRHKGVKLTEVTTSIKINESSEKVWEALSHFGNVSSFHAGVEKSVNNVGSPNKAALGVERTCDILDGKREVVLKEKITEYVEESHYRYEVFEWENFPLKSMFFGFKVTKISTNKSKLSLTINYRLKPGFMTNLMKWKIRKLERTVLTGYRHFIETGKKNTPIKEIEKLGYQFI